MFSRPGGGGPRRPGGGRFPSGLGGPRGGDFLSSSDREPKSSSAVGPVVGDVFFSIDIASDRIFCKLEREVRTGSRNGLRETGLGGGSSNGDGRAGEIARLRKGLFEDRLSDNPADCCPVCSGWVAIVTDAAELGMQWSAGGRSNRLFSCRAESRQAGGPYSATAAYLAVRIRMS